MRSNGRTGSHHIGKIILSSCSDVPSLLKVTIGLFITILYSMYRGKFHFFHVCLYKSETPNCAKRQNDSTVNQKQGNDLFLNHSFNEFESYLNRFYFVKRFQL